MLNNYSRLSHIHSTTIHDNPHPSSRLFYCSTTILVTVISRSKIILASISSPQSPTILTFPTFTLQLFPQVHRLYHYIFTIPFSLNNCSCQHPFPHLTTTCAIKYYPALQLFPSALTFLLDLDIPLYNIFIYILHIHILFFPPLGGPKAQAVCEGPWNF